MEKKESAMTEDEFEIIDQLYFVSSYQELAQSSQMDAELIQLALWNLMEKGWVKCLNNPETEIWPDQNDFAANYSKYYYLATKKGLFKHNEI